MSAGGGRKLWYAAESGATEADQKKFVRQCIVKCSRCDAISAERQAGLTDEALRRKFIQKGWRIARAQNQHLCPEHARKGEKKPHVAVTVAPAPSPAPVTPPAPPPPTAEIEPAELATQCSFCACRRIDLVVLKSDYICMVCIEDAVALLRLRNSQGAARPAPTPITRINDVPTDEHSQIRSKEDEEIADIIYGKRA
jgi:hypothetical protein